MGYFSSIDAVRVRDIQDHSITPPDKQLLWRLEELEDRLGELTNEKTGNWDCGACFSENDLRYVLPEHFFSATDVRRAIDLAVNDLAVRYGIYVGDVPEKEDPVMDEITGMQISFLDILSVQALQHQSMAA